MYTKKSKKKEIGKKKILFGKEEKKNEKDVCNCLDQGVSELTIMIKNALQMLCWLTTGCSK